MQQGVGVVLVSSSDFHHSLSLWVAVHPTILERNGAGKCSVLTAVILATVSKLRTGVMHQVRQTFF
jgi:hypothetical protein